MKNKYIAYLHSSGVSQKELSEIFSDKKSPEDFFLSLSHNSLKQFISSEKRRNNILEKYSKLSTDFIDQQLNKYGVTLFVVGDKGYPQSLLNIPHTPYIIYVRGQIPNGEMFGVVGSRKISEYGKRIIHNIVPEVSDIFPIVSGGAAGCDTLAHKACLDSKNPTVVVVGTGIDQTYPVSNQKLFNTIVEAQGAIISIFRLGEPGNPYNFPVRNEIVVGLSKGVLVIESKDKSGSLITAGLTLDLGKDLFSIPGDIFSPNSQGTNNLIKSGEAKCVTNSLDILEEYNLEVKRNLHKNVLVFSDSIEELIYNTISDKTQNIDDLSVSLHIPAQTLLAKVAMLELKGVVKKDLQGKYQLV